MALPVNIDSTYADSGSDASVALHQQHHDTIHGLLNGLSGPSSNYLTGDVTMTTAATYYDGPSLTLAAGSYLLLGHVIVLGVTNAFRTLQGKLWDGTTTISNDALNVPGTAGAGQGPLTFFGLVTPAGSTTYKISCTSTVNGDKIVHNATKGSYLLAVKIG